MTCDQIERDEIAERYLLGRLSDDEQERFEAHYFDCKHCLERLQVMEAAQAELAHAPASAALPAASRRWWRTAAALAAAAVIVLAVRVLQQTPPGDGLIEPTGQATRPADVPVLPPLSQGAAQAELLWAQLGAIDPPAYAPLRLRSNATDAQREFRSAMALYGAKNYADAASGLHRAVALPGAPVDANFYLGVCELQTGRVQDAAAAFERVIAFGESPYLEDAHFLLAKARIRQRDATAARTQLLRVITLEGDRQEEARRLMSQLPQ
jgi:tetratricopeptide (TPR) repeat protein